MRSQSQIERLLKEIHLMVAGCQQVEGSPGKIIIDKNELFQKLEEINISMYDMMDQYAVSQQERARVRRDLQDQGDAIIENASSQAEDVYGASVLYMDEAILHLVRIFEEAQKSADKIYKQLGDSIEAEKRVIRGNQKELQDQMFEMRDANLYLNILDDRRRLLEKNKKENQVAAPEKALEVLHSLKEFSTGIKASQAEIKVNPSYFEKTGKTVPGMEDTQRAAPEVKVNLNSNYFKWKQNQDKKGEADEEQE